MWINLSLPGQNGRHIADNICKRVFMNIKCSVSIRILPEFVPKGPIDKKLALVQVKACRLFGAKS